MLAEENEVSEVPSDVLQNVLDIELVNGTGLYPAIRGDEMIFVEFSIGEAKVMSSKRSNTLHPVWNDSLKLHFNPISGKTMDLHICILTDIDGKTTEIATRKLKDLEKTLVESVPFNALDYKFGKEKRITFSLTALNFGLHEEMSQAKKLSLVAEEFSKYIVHLYVHLQNVEKLKSDKLLKLQEDLDCENFLVKQKRIMKEDFDQLDSEIGVFKNVLKEANYDPTKDLDRETAIKIRQAIEGNSILFEMFKSFTESMKSQLSTKKKKGKKGKNRNYVRSFIKGVKKRGKRLSKFKGKKDGKQGYVYKGNIQFIFRREVRIKERKSDFESRGKWRRRGVKLINHPTATGKSVENLYIKLQLLAKLSQELPIPRIYGIVSSVEQAPPSPQANRLSMNELKVSRLSKEVSILVDDEPPEYSLFSFLNENSETIGYETRMKLANQLMESLKLLHEDDFRHGYLSLKSLYFRIPNEGKKKIKSRNRSPSQINPTAHPLILGRSYLSLIDQYLSKPIPREEAGYLAPEIITQQFGEQRVPTYTEESDVFSFGMCLFLILGGRLQRVYHRQYGRQPRKTLACTFPKSFEEAPMIMKDPFIKDILLDCLNPDPSKRPSMRKIMRRIRDGNQENRGRAIFYCRSIEEDDADAEEISVSDFSMKGLRSEIKRCFGEKTVVESVFEMTDAGEQREMKWNQDVLDLKENAMIVVKFAPEGTKIVYPDEEEETDEFLRKTGSLPTTLSPPPATTATNNKYDDDNNNNEKRKKADDGNEENDGIMKDVGSENNSLQLSVDKNRVSTGFDGPKLHSQFAEDSEDDDDDDEEEDYSYNSGEDGGDMDSDYEREPIVFYLRSNDEDDDDADDYLMNDFTISELKSTIFKERSGEFIKQIMVKKDDESTHEIFTDGDLKEYMDEDDMVIVTFGEEGEEVIPFEKRYKMMNLTKHLPKQAPSRSAPSLPQEAFDKSENSDPNNVNNNNTKESSATITSDNKMLLLQEENIKLKEELEQYKRKCTMLEKKIEELNRRNLDQNKEIGHMKLRMFGEF